jgi:hypothetical protein
MRKYLYWFVLLVAVSIFITSKHEQYSNDSNPQTGNSDGTVSAPKLPQAESNGADSKWYSPSGNLFYYIFGWPNGVTVWALFLTLIVIADQTAQTKKAAEAARDSVIEAKNSLSLSRDTAQRQLRAYVCVESAFLKFPERNITEPRVYFKNSGQTPAYNVRGWIHTWFAEYPPQEVFPVPPHDFVMAKTILGPGTKTTFVAARKSVEPQLAEFLGTPQLTLYVYGEVHYNDAFGIDRTTKYRLIHGGPEGIRKITGKDGMAEKWILMPDTHGNEAT